SKSLRQGAGLHEDTQMGPLVSKEQHERVLSDIEKGRQEGAKIAAGGTCPYEQGYFVSPTVFTNVEDEMTIAKEELFGPVLAAIPYETVDEVIERANRSEYGLAAG
uniref:aldehyde dehydrogenase family protein n=1 Tax=Bacillus licheniformis TaxID=1402 RepID=UPI0034A00032